MGVLAIDPGTRKCGFAYTDRARILTSALEPFRHEADEGRLFRHIESLLAERDVSLFLVGLPLDPGGATTEQSELVSGFVARLGERFAGFEIRTYNEHGTTKEAESRLRDLGHDGRGIRLRKDSWAALVLLEDWLAAGEPA